MPYASPHPDIPIPDVRLEAYVLDGAGRFGDRPAVIDHEAGIGLSYRELDAAVAEAAARLEAGGVGPGSVVGLFGPNWPGFVAAYYAVLRVGGTVTPISSLATADDVTRQLDDAGARAVLALPPLVERAREAVFGSDIGVIEVDPLTGEFIGDIALGSGRPIDPDLASLPYSSGTTGLPKGVMLTHRNLVANAEQILACQRMDATDVLIGVLPFFHIYGMGVNMNCALRAGATVVTIPRFDLAAFLGAIERFSVTRAFLAPPVVLALAKHPSVTEYDLRSLRVIICGAAPLDTDVASACAERVGADVGQGYGMTEASPVTHIQPDFGPRADPGSIAWTVPNTELRLVSVDTGEEVGPGVPGEIQVRGPQVMRGYLNRTGATAETITGDGWLRTGDIATIDEQRVTRVVDRVKELIKVSGYQVPPAELEAILLGHPDVIDAAVIPIPDEQTGERPKAFVVPRGELDTEALAAYVAGKVAPYKRLAAIEVIDAIPKSASGKILRRVLVEQDRAAR